MSRALIWLDGAKQQDRRIEPMMEIDSDHVLGNTGDVQALLTERETDVLAFLARGMSNKEIASLLRISNQTVKNHVTSILRKLGVENRMQARLVALRQGRAHPDQNIIS